MFTIVREEGSGGVWVLEIVLYFRTWIYIICKIKTFEKST